MRRTERDEAEEGEENGSHGIGEESDERSDGSRRAHEGELHCIALRETNQCSEDLLKEVKARRGRHLQRWNEKKKIK